LGGTNLILVLVTSSVAATLKGTWPVPARRLVHGLVTDHRVSDVDRATTNPIFSPERAPPQGGILASPGIGV
jgi:hypothetical protein